MSDKKNFIRFKSNLTKLREKFQNVQSFTQSVCGVLSWPAKFPLGGKKIEFFNISRCCRVVNKSKSKTAKAKALLDKNSIKKKEMKNKTKHYTTQHNTHKKEK